MKTKNLFKLPGIILAIVVLVTAAAGARADAINKKQVLRKAGGPSTGTLTQVMVTTYPFGGGPAYSYQSYDRSGTAKIPKKKGGASTFVQDPGTDEDSTVTGSVRKPKIKRGGKLIKYSAGGSMDLIFDEEQPFTGNATATSKVRGKKVKTSGNLAGARNLEEGDTEMVTCVAKGTGKY